MILRKNLDVLFQVFDQVFGLNIGFFQFLAAVVEVAKEVL